MGSGRWRMIASLAATVALAGASGALALADGGGGETGRGNAGDLIDVELASASQRHIADADRLEVRVEADGAVRLRLRGLSRLGGKAAKVARSRVARLEAGETSKLGLALTSKGRQRLAGCGDQQLVVKARASDAGDRLGDRDDDRERVTEKLAVDAPACAAAGPPGGDGGGGGGGEGDSGGEGGDGLDASPTARCDPLDPSHCLYPWPNDLFTEDASTPTGHQIALDPLAMPRSRQGVPILPEPFNRSDGFSPGNMIVTRIPGLDTPAAFDQTDPVPITHLSEYDDPDQPVVVINTATGERHPVWSELDSNPQDPGDVTLIIRPAVNFDEGGHYIVALRNLRDADGDPIDAQEPFRVYRDNLPSGDPEVEERRPHMEDIFGTLAAADPPIARDDLYLAWDFTVASEQNLTERALHLRDDAFAELGDTNLADLQVPPGSSAPEFTVEGFQNFTPAENSHVARRVTGSFTIPCYLNEPGCPTGSRFVLPPDSNIPQRIPGNTMQADFICNIPRAALDGSNPPLARPSLYGHGLLGNDDEVNSSPQQLMVGEHDFMYCATDWAGFATQDAPTILATLQDLNNFPSFVDRTQQGFLNFLYLGRLMIHPDGFGSDAAFQVDPGLPGGGDERSVIDTQRLFYDGNSQGGILGGALAAIAPDHERAVLGVPGMNYSTLLRRSSDFHPYAEGDFSGEVCGELPGIFEEICNSAPGDTPLGLYDNYPNELERPLILSLIQMQWDRAEANGYAPHMTDDPLTDTPPHEVLLHVAFGDHQVTQWAAEVEARTIGASVHTPTFDDPNRHPDVDELFGVPPIVYDASDDFFRSALVYWDSGPGRTGAPPITNTPPGSPENGEDPHSDPRNTVAARLQKSLFLQAGGWVEDVCDGPCHTDQYEP